ncbi:hypothetical protein [Methylobacterium sp. A54F]
MRIWYFALIALIIADTSVEAQQRHHGPARQQAGSIAFNPSRLRTDGGYIYTAPVVASLSQFQAPERMLDLRLMLALKAEPADAKNNPHSYLPLMDREVWRRYANKRTIFSLERFTGSTNGEDSWLGDDEFQISDSKKGFIREFSKELEDFGSRAPTRFAYVQGFSAIRYDSASQSFVLGDHSWSNGGFSDTRGPRSLVITAPLKYPKAWSLSEKDARAFRQIQVQQGQRNALDGSRNFGRIFLVTRFEISRLRNENNTYYADAKLVDLRLVGDWDPTTVLAILPNPPDADILGRPNTRSPQIPTEGQSASFTPLLDPEYPRLLAARLDPTLVANQVFMTTSLNLRRMIERTVLSGRGDNGMRFRTTWPRLLSSTLLQTDTAPNGEDIEQYRKMFIERSGMLPNRIRISNIQSWRQNNQSISVDLTKAFDGWASLSPVNTNSYALELARNRRPNALGQILLPAGKDFTVIALMEPSPHWFDLHLTATGMPKLGSDDGRLTAEFDIVTPEILDAKSGEKILLFGLLPKAVSVEAGTSPNVTFGAAESVKTFLTHNLATPARPNGYKYDIQGVKLGMDVDEAAKMLVSSLPGLEWASADLTNRDPVAGVDSAMPKFLQIDFGKVDDIYERYLLAYNPQDRKIIFLKRATNVGMNMDGKNSASMDRDVRRSALEKYGTQDFLASQIVMIWAPDPVHRARLSKAPGCYGIVGRLYDADYFRSDFLTDQCGEVLSIQAAGGRAGYLLYDSTKILNIRTTASSTSRLSQP